MFFEHDIAGISKLVRASRLRTRFELIFLQRTIPRNEKGTGFQIQNGDAGVTTTKNTVGILVRSRVSKQLIGDTGVLDFQFQNIRRHLLP